MSQLLQYILDKKHHAFRKENNWDLAGEYSAKGLSPEERMTDRFERLCAAQEPVFLPDGKAADMLLWKDILQFNWECILSVAEKVLARGLDVIIDYVIEDELPRIQKLAEAYNAKLYYIVLTASEEALRQRICQRGDVDLIDRALFLKKKLDSMPENQGHLFDNTNLPVEQELDALKMESFQV